MAKQKMKMEWNGDDVFDAEMKAAVVGVNLTMGLAVRRAKRRPRMPYLTGNLSRSVRIQEQARIIGKTTVTGIWGSTGVGYAEKQEKRKGFLLGGADEAYPRLFDYIQRSR